AQRAAEDWKRRRAAADRAADAQATTLTVRAALQNYIAARKTRDMKAGRDAELRLTHHVLGAPLADMGLFDLREVDLSIWRSTLRRGGRGGKANVKPLAAATLARLLNDLRAALTAAARKYKAPADLMTTIKDGLRAPRQPDRARPKQILAD